MKTKICTLLTMSRPLGTLLLLLTLLCGASWSSPAAAETTSTTKKMYAVLDADGTTLTFKYDENMPESGGYLVDGDYNFYPSWSTANTRNNVTKVVFEESFKSARPTLCERWFADFKNLKSIEGLTNLDTRNVTDMKAMFSGCSEVTELDLSNFYANEDVDMREMFKDCTKLTTIYVNEFRFKTPTKGDNMFEGCVNLKADAAYKTNEDKKVAGYADQTFAKVIGGYFYDRSYIKPWVKYDGNSTLTFQYSYKTQFGADEYEVLDKNYEYSEEPAWCKNHSSVIEQVKFDKSFAQARPTTCCRWFYNCSKLKNFTGFENLNTSEVTNMTEMFYGCRSLTTLDLNSFNTQKVTDMTEMFYGCRSLTTLDLNSFNTQNVTNM